MAEGRTPQGSEPPPVIPERPAVGGKRGIRFSGITLLFRLLIAFVYRFGKPTGTPYLTQLKNIAESAQ